MAQNTLLLLMLVMANVPCLSERVFLVLPPKKYPKSISWCLLELIVYYGLFVVLAVYAETGMLGNAAPQGWEFYAVTVSLFCVLAFPSFIYKALWK
jgi:hypothetical protein